MGGRGRRQGPSQKGVNNRGLAARRVLWDVNRRSAQQPAQEIVEWVTNAAGFSTSLLASVQQPAEEVVVAGGRVGQAGRGGQAQRVEPRQAARLLWQRRLQVWQRRRWQRRRWQRRRWRATRAGQRWYLHWQEGFQLRRFKAASRGGQQRSPRRGQQRGHGRVRQRGRGEALPLMLPQLRRGGGVDGVDAEQASGRRRARAGVAGPARQRQRDAGALAEAVAGWAWLPKPGWQAVGGRGAQRLSRREERGEGGGRRRSVG
mgnify:CR=1 FL=1